METGRLSKQDGFIALAVGLCAFVVYWLTLAVGAYPGEFSSALAQGAGLFPRLAPDYPVWFGLARLLGTLAPVSGDVALPLNLASAIAGAASVGLMYHVVATLIFGSTRVDDENERYARFAARAGALSASLALAFSVPFWVVATRSHWASLHVAMLLLLAHWFLRFVFHLRHRIMILFGLLYGIGIVEYPGLIVFAPLFAGVYLALLWHREALEFKEWAPVASVALLAALGLYALAAWSFYQTPGYVLREQQGYFDVLWSMWRDQWYLLARSLPGQGWLVVIVSTILPAAVALMICRRSLNAEHDWTYYLLHIVLTALAVAVMLNVRFAPWPLLGYRSFLVMPYVLAGALWGYIVAYWMLLLSPWNVFSSRPTVRRLRYVLGVIVALLGVAVPGYAAVRNRVSADGQSSAFIRQIAAEVVQSLAGRTWLLTDGTLDGAIMVEARRQGVPVRLIDLSSDKNPLMRRYAAGLFDDTRLRNVGQLSIHTLVRTWLEQDTNVINQVAIMGGADYWVESGFQPVVNKMVFLGARALNNVSADACMRENREFWRRLEQMPALTQDNVRSPLDPYRRHVVRHLGLMANNLGVLMEDLGRVPEAYEAYTHARTIDPGNVSALMNQYTLIQHGFAAPDAEAVRSALAEFAKVIAARPPRIGALSQYYGYVRSPTAFANMGWEWALSGQPELAAAGLRRAMGLSPEKGRSQFKQALAGLYMMQNQGDEGETLFFELLVENPRNHGALLGMARIELARGHADKAREYLERAAQAGVPDVLMRMEWASFYMGTDDLPQAKDILRKLVEEKPDLLRAWSMMTAINIQEHDALGLYDTIRRVNRLKQGNELLLAIANGYLAIMQDDLSTASSSFEKALSLRPDDPQILEWVIRLDIVQGRPERMQSRLSHLLQLDPGNAFGNYAMGAMQMDRRQFDLARDSLTRSVETQRTPEALNDLAWLLQESGLYQEAEQHVRSALELRPGLYQAWDTLGEILFKTDRLEEARSAYEKALSLKPDSVPVALHMAALDLKQGRRAEAAQRVEDLQARRQDLTTADTKALDLLRRQF
ncbi:MAG: tetratricopeptide repeat protein [Lentisphaerae bacterium]|nr:tetratricopeptide repeat protein [Lentisphaerota bacterium]